MPEGHTQGTCCARSRNQPARKPDYRGYLSPSHPWSTWFDFQLWKSYSQTSLLLRQAKSVLQVCIVVMASFRPWFVLLSAWLEVEPPSIPQKPHHSSFGNECPFVPAPLNFLLSLPRASLCCLTDFSRLATCFSRFLIVIVWVASHVSTICNRLCS